MTPDVRRDWRSNLDVVEVPRVRSQLAGSRAKSEVNFSAAQNRGRDRGHRPIYLSESGRRSDSAMSDEASDDYDLDGFRDASSDFRYVRAKI